MVLLLMEIAKTNGPHGVSVEVFCALTMSEPH